ncbi:MAG: hypothetical protein R3E12_14890 [Candidatus Eisenbacteria bacterium]
MADHRFGFLAPLLAGPPEPRILVLVEHEERLIAQLGELRSPSGAAPDRLIVEDLPDHVDLLARVDLMPDRLQHLLEEGRVPILAMHHAANVLEADVAVEELLVVEGPDPASAVVLVTLEAEVDLLDVVPFGGRAELGLGSGSGTAEQNAFFRIDDATLRPPARTVVPVFGHKAKSVPGRFGLPT